MEKYNLLREFADSWGLLSMLAFFVVAVLMLFRPGAAKLHADAANIPLRDDEIDRCAKNCATCTCKTTTLKLEAAK